MGDPAGIGPEVILKAAGALGRTHDRPRLLVIGDFGAMKATAERLGHHLPQPYEWAPGLSGVSNPTDPGAPTEPRFARANRLAVLSVGRLAARSYRPGRPTVAGADAAYQSIVTGARMALAGEIDALVTAPISKEWLNRAGHRFNGHSELLADLAGVREWRMMFAGERLKLALVTVHMPLAQVADALSSARVYGTIRLLAAHLRNNFALAQPRIAVLGFNPHAGENGLFGDEERRAITPAIRRARRAGIDAFGPLAPDTAFIRQDGEFAFDAAVAMYHDQGLIALKTLEFDRAVNITLGLPFVRTSPDHGTAFAIAGAGTADPSSMIAALNYAARAARHARGGARRAA